MNSAVESPPVPRQETLGLALSAIARTAAESLKLTDVFPRVAEAARQVLPFEVMGVSVVEDPEVPWEDLENVTFSAYAVSGDLRTEDIGQYRRSDVSPGVRLDAIGKVFRHNDVRTVLDASYLLDRRILALDCRSLMSCLLPAARPLGTIWFASSRVGAFSSEDEATVLAIADLVAAGSSARSALPGGEGAPAPERSARGAAADVVEGARHPRGLQPALRRRRRRSCRTIGWRWASSRRTARRSGSTPTRETGSRTCRRRSRLIATRRRTPIGASSSFGTCGRSPGAAARNTKA